MPRPALSRSAAIRGFTIVEIVVALTLLVVGALAVAGASATAARATGNAEAQLFAMTVAQRRLESLAAVGCSRMSDGSAADSSSQLSEWWNVTPARNGLRLATDSVEYLERGARRALVRRRLIVC